MGERTYQQRLVWDRLSDNFDVVSGSNLRLESRATVITTSSTAIVAIVSAAKFFPSAVNWTLSFESVLLGLVCFCSIALFWYGSRVWRPHPRAVPGPTDPKLLYNEYIALDEDVAFNNALIDLGKAVDVALSANKIKSDAVTNMVRILQLQLLFLSLSVAWSGIVGLWSAAIA